MNLNAYLSLVGQPLDQVPPAVATDLTGRAESPPALPDPATTAALYEWLANWLEAKAETEILLESSCHSFIDAVMQERARRLRETAARLRQTGTRLRSSWLEGESLRHARLLAALFEVESMSLDGRQLPFAPTQTMNVRAQLSLVARKLRRAAERTDGRLVVPDAEYVATLDADSILLPMYLGRLVEALEAPGNGRVAIAQTPYSSIPNASSPLEQVAGATTDLQYVVHQGFTAHAATFWVGANAVIRKRALDEIATTTWEDGFPVRRYVHDRTVIEDTESSVDLAAAGWTLLNYPERLSYSATPPDFGALTVQRRRWANGGLIILPKCFRYLASGPRHARRFSEAFLRTHYLASIAASNIAFLILLLCPFNQRLGPPWLPFLGIPYLLLFARELALSGHRARHVIDVTALNLVLLPVNLGGVVKSIQQALLGHKTPFARTPKVVGRTPSPALYILGVGALLLANAAVVGVDAAVGRWWHLGFASATGTLAAYGAFRFVGLRTAAADLALALKHRRRRSPATTPGATAALNTD
jgi:hypothetical protein